MNPNATETSIGAELLDVIVRINRWATYHAELALPPAQSRLLGQIDALGRARIVEIARSEHCSQPTMTTQVQRLEALGLIERLPDPSDARASLVSLTEQGSDLLKNIRQARAAVIAPLIARLNEADKNRLPTTLHTMNALLKAAYAESPSSGNT